MSIAGKLIKIVKNHPILFDSSDVDYRNNERKDQLWDEIAVQLNENVMEVKKRWRNLRDTYVKLLKLVKSAEKDPVFEAAAVRKYHKWVLTKEMEYFRPHFTYGSQLNVSILDKVDTKKEQKSKVKRQTVLKRKLPKRHSSPELVTVQTATRQKTSTERLNPPITEAGRNQEITPLDLDAIDRLFLAHAQNIKQFSARRQALTKLKIAEVIMEQEILHQEDVELASISATTAKGIFNRSRQEDDSPPAFETVCGYGSDEGDDVNMSYSTKTETDDDNPVAVDEMKIYL